MKKIFENSWQELLEEEMDKPYYLKLRKDLINEYSNRIIYPDMHSIFNALHLTDYKDVKAVILGQDPYHGRGQAHGLAFSVKPGIPTPPSLVNIYKELNSDLGYPIPHHGYLVKWAKEGVLLLNAVLTVREGQPNTHKSLGWEQFTDSIIDILNKREKPIVFILWGANAIKKEAKIDLNKHLIIKSPHPSPLAAYRGFFASKPFSRTNEFLVKTGQTPIDWRLDVELEEK